MNACFKLETALPADDVRWRLCEAITISRKLVMGRPRLTGIVTDREYVVWRDRGWWNYGFYPLLRFNVIATEKGTLLQGRFDHDARRGLVVGICLGVVLALVLFSQLELFDGLLAALIMPPVFGLWGWLVYRVWPCFTSGDRELITRELHGIVSSQGV